MSRSSRKGFDPTYVLVALTGAFVLLLLLLASVSKPQFQGGLLASPPPPGTFGTDGTFGPPAPAPTPPVAPPVTPPMLPPPPVAAPPPPPPPPMSSTFYCDNLDDGDEPYETLCFARTLPGTGGMWDLIEGEGYRYTHLTTQYTADGAAPAANASFPRAKMSRMCTLSVTYPWGPGYTSAANYLVGLVSRIGFPEIVETVQLDQREELTEVFARGATGTTYGRTLSSFFVPAGSTPFVSMIALDTDALTAVDAFKLECR